MRGRCLCGTVQFEIVGALPALYQCHCSLCRKQSGGASNAATIVDADQLRWLSGEGAVRSWKKATGFRSDFCSTCGSPVPNVLGDKPYYWVPAGLLEEDGALRVAVHLHMGSKARWEPEPAGGTHHHDMPAFERGPVRNSVCEARITVGRW